MVGSVSYDPADEEDREDIAADNDIKLYWTLYGRTPDGTHEAISDMVSETAAHTLMFKISGIVGVAGQENYDVPRGLYEAIPAVMPVELDATGV